MPLVGYHLLGFDREPLSFETTDYRLLKSQNHRDRVEAFFANTPWRFNLIFLNCNAEKRVWLCGPTSLRRLEMLLNDFGEITDEIHNENQRLSSLGEYPHNRKHQIWQALDQDAINYLYINNLPSVDQIPMTPWMIAHRMAHTPSLEGTNHMIIEPLLKWNEIILHDCYGFSMPRRESFSSIDTRTGLIYSSMRKLWYETLSPFGDSATPNARLVHGLYQGITASRAGRMHKIRSADYVPEWFCQYILHGELRFGRLPEMINPEILPGNLPEDFNLGYPRQSVTLKSREKERTHLGRLEGHFLKYLNDILNNWTGKVCII